MIVNRHFASLAELDATIAKRCRRPAETPRSPAAHRVPLVAQTQEAELITRIPYHHHPRAASLKAVICELVPQLTPPTPTA